MNHIIAAVKSDKMLINAVNSCVNTVFYLSPNISTLEDNIKLVQDRNKKIYIHMDMAEGLGKDKYALQYVKSLGVDGIISTRGNIIKCAKDIDLSTVQRFFIIDSQSVHTAIETTKSTKPDMIEIMPGIATKTIKKIKSELLVPIIAGGLIETEEEINCAITMGASKISTSNENMWTKEY